MGGATAAFLAGSRAPVAEAGADHTVYVNDNNFCGTAGANCLQPYSIQINPGQQVQWLDGEPGVSHSVTQCTANWASCPAPGGFDSGLQNDPPGPYVSQTFSEEGVVYYRCQLHGNPMRGLITVGEPATPTPSPTPGPSPTSAPTPTQTPSVTPTAAPTATPDGGRADVNCDGETDGSDVMALLVHRANLPGPATAGDSCQPIGSPQGDETKGDLNCDGAVDAGDAIIALRVWAGLSAAEFVPAGCPAP